MDTQKVDVLIREADKMLQTAQDEMQRADEDVITHSVCFSSRQAIVNYFTAFLLNNGVQPVSPPTMAALLDQCRDIDGRFDLINIDNIHCRFETHDRDYCLSVKQVDECFQIAKQAKGIAQSVTPGY